MTFVLRLPKGIGLHGGVMVSSHTVLKIRVMSQSPELENTDEECVCVCMYVCIFYQQIYTYQYITNILQYFVIVIYEGQIILFLNLLKNIPFFI